VVATGGVDGAVHLYDVQQQQHLAELTGHTKRVTGVTFVTPELLLSCSADKTVRMWAPKAAEGGVEEGAGGAAGGMVCQSVLQEHSGPVVGMSLHPSRRYFVSASEDATWAFWDVGTATCLKQVRGGLLAKWAGRGKIGAATCLE
jgi:pre-mRNA-processing factor 19